MQLFDFEQYQLNWILLALLRLVSILQFSSDSGRRPSSIHNTLYSSVPPVPSVRPQYKYSWSRRRQRRRGVDSATHATRALITICQAPRCRAGATRCAPRRSSAPRPEITEKWVAHVYDWLHLHLLPGFDC